MSTDISGFMSMLELLTVKEKLPDSRKVCEAWSNVKWLGAKCEVKTRIWMSPIFCLEKFTWWATLVYNPPPREETHQKIPTCWAQPLLACANQLKPRNHLPYQICQLKNTGKVKSTSHNLTAIIMFTISKPPLSLGEFNKSAPFFGFSLCCLDLSKTLELVLGWARSKMDEHSG